MVLGFCVVAQVPKHTQETLVCGATIPRSFGELIMLSDLVAVGSTK